MNTSRDYQDLIAGGILVVLGIFAAWYAAERYPLGTVARMGPGMFPTAIGVLLAVLGVVIALPALARRGTLPIPEFRPLLLVMAGIVAFALTIETLGMVPAIFIMGGLAVLADNKLGVVGYLVLATVVSLGAWLIFRVGLGIPLYPFTWGT